jgi:hypothetical protein
MFWYQIKFQAVICYKTFSKMTHLTETQRTYRNFNFDWGRG